jgi:beta-ring hydroxylase
MFGACAVHGAEGKLAEAAASGEPVEMENYFSRLALDIIGKVRMAGGGGAGGSDC